MYNIFFGGAWTVLGLMGMGGLIQPELGNKLFGAFAFGLSVFLLVRVFRASVRLVDGGNANDYVYPVDPVNWVDVDGRFGLPSWDEVKGAASAVRRVVAAVGRKTYRHATVGYAGCFLFCGDIKFQGGRVTVSVGGFGVLAKGPYVGYANQRAAGRQTCSVFAGAAYKAGVQGSMGFNRRGGAGGGARAVPGDWVVTVFPGVGVAYGAMCGLGVNVPRLPR